jgi:hypothetical protein
VPEDLDAIFEQVKPLMARHAPPFQVKVDKPGRFELHRVKDLVIEGRKRKDVYFAGLIKQKSYVGFYYMPVYVEAEMKELFPPELLKLLKGKSCFHLKRIDDQLLGQIERVLADGARLYQERGWL